MPILHVTGKRFRQIVSAGADRVIKNRDHLNRINVFPVPDGDTGTNMSSTLIAAVREMDVLKETSLESVAKAAAWGALMGARGNSGIILAQIFSGLANSIQGRDRMLAEDLAAAFALSGEKARKAILRPAEGTILTVIQDVSDSAREVVRDNRDLAVLIETMAASARSSVERTPLLLPKLKEAGVVDAGGMGLALFLEGIFHLVQGINVADADVATASEPTFGTVSEENMVPLKFRYCTEFILKGSRISEDDIRNTLASMGDSLVVVGDTHLARVHIHTGTPEDILKYASGLGQVSSIKVDDMLIQHTARFQESNNAKHTSVISVALGDGLKELFYNAGAEMVVDGGPTQNPSTSDLIAAVEMVASQDVVILPNHKNIYPVAIQAAQMTPKRVTVLRTGSVIEGLSSLLAYMDDSAPEENIVRMSEAFGHIKTGEVAVASRDAVQSDVQVTAGDLIGIYDGKVRISCTGQEDAVKGLISAMIGPSTEIITIYYGSFVQQPEAERLQNILKELYADIEVELYYGGQPYAPYIVSVE